MRFPTVARQGLVRPIIPVRVMAANGNWALVDSLVDMGADITLFAARNAQQLGIDLSGLPDLPLTSALGTSGTYRLAEVVLEVRHPPSFFRWRTQVGFILRPLAYGILGTKGFFQFFTISYNERAGTLDIDPSGPLPP